MQKYYIEQHLEDSKFDNKDLFSVIIIIALAFAIVYFVKNKSTENNIKIIEPYYVEKFYKAPSKSKRFKNTEYDIAVSKLLLEDGLRNLKYKVKDLNSSLSNFKNDLLKQQAMNDIILMLSQVKKGNLDSFDVSKMQQAVLEAGYGNIDSKLLEKAVSDYKYKIAQEEAIQSRIALERKKTEDKIKKDSEEATVLAADIARDIAEDEIESFIENLSLIARVGHFVVQKVSEE